MSRLKIKQSLLLIMMLILTACAQGQIPGSQALPATTLATPFTVYAKGSALHLNLPLNLSAQAVWTMSPAMGQLTGQGRHGTYTPPSSVATKTTVHLLFTDAKQPNKAYALDLNLLPPGLAAQATAVGPTGMTLCASEGGPCSFTGTQTVAYGANGAYTYKLVTGGTDCNNLIFGDPLYGTVKSCFVGDAILMNAGGPTGYTYCANEGDQCAFTGSDNVAYGANGSFAIHTKVDGVACTNAIFGDSLPGVLKACYVKAAAPTGYKFCALENQSCDFTGSQKVAYGANDQFTYLDQTAGTSCSNLVFGDPVPGSVKACYLPITDQGSPGTPSDADLIPASDITATIEPSITPPTAFTGSEVGFSGMGSVGNALSYSWDFGDGTSGVGDPEASGDTVHTYTTPGYYTSKLTVTDAPTGTVKTADYKIAILPDVNDMPSSRVVNVNGSLTFDVRYPLPNLTYEWTFSDGTVLQGPAVTRTVSQGGFITYTLRVYDGTLDENGQRHVTAQDEARYNVALPPLDGTILNIIPHGNSNALRAYFPVPNDGTNVQIISYDWDFGDGQRLITTTDIVEHVYGHTGNFAVTLRATDNYGRQATVHHAVVRQNSLGINFHLQACLNELVGTCQWPEPPIVHSPSPCSKGATPLIIICGGSPLPQSLPENGGGQTGFSANMFNLIPTAGTQVLSRFYPVNASLPVVESSFGPLTAGENVISVDGNTASVYAFDGLRVPDYVVNILPDEQFDFMALPPEPLQYRDRQGIIRLLQIVNIPERQILAGDQISFAIPIYAIDKSGALLSSLSGNLYAHFKGDSGLSASSVDLVNGVGQMQVQASIADIQAGKVVPGKVEVISPSCYNDVVSPNSTNPNNCKFEPGVDSTLPNYYCSIYYAGEYDSYYTYGCASLVTSSEAPIGLTSAMPVVQLFADGITAQRATGALHALALVNISTLNNINLGATQPLRKALDGYLKKFDGSAAQFIVGFVPLVGSGSDLMIQAYTYGTTGKADPVIVTFGVVGVAFDIAGVVDFETTLPAAETAKGLVGVYKIGGPFTKEAIKGLTVVLKGGVTPAEAYALLKGSASFLGDAVAAGTNPTQLRDSLEAAIKLATESTGNAFNGLKLFSKSYSDLRIAGVFANKNLSFINKMKIAKYGMFAPETAKAMARCGSTCVEEIDYLSKSLISKASETQLKAISRIEDIQSIINDSTQPGVERINNITFKTLGSFCKIFSTLSFSSIHSQGFSISQCLMSKQELADHIRQYAEHIKFNANKRTASIIQLPDGRKFQGISGKVDGIPIDSEIKALYDNQLQCLEAIGVTSSTNGKCAEAKALTRALIALRADGKNIADLKGSLSIAVEVRLDKLDPKYNQIKSACAENCIPVLKKLGIEFINPSEVK